MALLPGLAAAALGWALGVLAFAAGLAAALGAAALGLGLVAGFALLLAALAGLAAAALAAGLADRDGLAVAMGKALLPILAGGNYGSQLAISAARAGSGSNR